MTEKFLSCALSAEVALEMASSRAAGVPEISDCATATRSVLDTDVDVTAWLKELIWPIVVNKSLTFRAVQTDVDGATSVRSLGAPLEPMSEDSKDGARLEATTNGFDANPFKKSLSSVAEVREGFNSRTMVRTAGASGASK